MSRNYVYAVALFHPLTQDPVPMEVFERVSIDLPTIVYNLFAIDRTTTRGFWRDGNLYVRTTEPIYYAYQTHRFLLQYVSRTVLLDYKIQFERRALPVPTRRRRASFFELMPWERDTTRCANANVGPVEVHRPATPPLPCVVPLPAEGAEGADKAETAEGSDKGTRRPDTPRPRTPVIEFGAAKNEFVARPTLHCPE